MDWHETLQKDGTKDTSPETKLLDVPKDVYLSKRRIQSVYLPDYVFTNLVTYSFSLFRSFFLVRVKGDENRKKEKEKGNELKG